MSKPNIPDDLPRIPQRALDSHKGDYGNLLIIGGAKGMSGAAILAARAAFRAGVGKATVAVPAAAWLPVASQLIEPTTVALADDDAPGRFSVRQLDALLELADGFDAVVFGCGLGRAVPTAELVNAFIERCPKPMVLDADALTQLDVKRLRRDRSRPLPAVPPVLTPHPGEMAALCGLSTSAIQADRPGTASRFVRDNRCILVLKGQKTAVADSDRIAINETGNPGMATGGSGDVLSGIIGALLAAGQPGFAAARLGAWLHGRSGDIASESVGRTALIASDIVDGIAGATQELEKKYAV